MRPVIYILLLLGGCFTPLSNAQGVKFFRYLDDHGRIVINDSIPPHQVSKGYEVLDSYGQIVEVVAGQGSQDERQQRRFAIEQENEDRALLRRYASPLDVKAARDRYLKELSIRIDTLQATLVAARSQLESAEKVLQTMAEEDEQRSLYIKNVQLLHSEIKQVSEQINERIAERQQSEQQFAKELSRLKELKGECGQC